MHGTVSVGDGLDLLTVVCQECFHNRIIQADGYER